MTWEWVCGPKGWYISPSPSPGSVSFDISSRMLYLQRQDSILLSQKLFEDLTFPIHSKKWQGQFTVSTITQTAFVG